MPHRFYHGKTGRVFNVTRHAVGIIVNKRVRYRVIAKRINVRIEHIKHSQCRADFLNRVKLNEQLKRGAKESGKSVPLASIKRQPLGPRKQHLIRTQDNQLQIVEPIPYQFVA
jgi:large subunit ribosomal protein L21e